MAGTCNNKYIFVQSLPGCLCLCKAIDNTRRLPLGANSQNCVKEASRIKKEKKKKEKKKEKNILAAGGAKNIVK